MLFSVEWFAILENSPVVKINISNISSVFGNGFAFQ